MVTISDVFADDAATTAARAEIITNLGRLSSVVILVTVVFIIIIIIIITIIVVRFISKINIRPGSTGSSG